MFVSNKVKSEICEICGDKAQIKYVTRSYGKSANLLVIEKLSDGGNFARNCADKIASEKFCAGSEKLRSQNLSNLIN